MKYLGKPFKAAIFLAFMVFGWISLGLVYAQEEDVTPPTLVALDFNPKEINTTSGSATITVDFTVTDDFSGARNFDVRFISPSGIQIGQGSIYINPATINYTGSVEITFPQYSELGIWTIGWVWLQDALYNWIYLSPADLAPLGLPTELINGLLETTGAISGTLSKNGTGFGGLTVKLLDDNEPTIVIDEQITDLQGSYVFDGVDAGTYQVMIVEPLGYIADQNFVITDLASGATNTVDFALTQIVLANNARGKGYWKHQFDVHIEGKGPAQESETELQGYIDEVRYRYNPYFSIFAAATDGTDDFDDWQATLSVKGNAGMAAKAKAQLAALILNMASLKLAQSELVTADSKTAGDVLTYVSELIIDGDGSNDELAKDLAEAVNTQEIIGSGIVPSGNILYKGHLGRGILWNFGVLEEYALHDNYPNPFNPSTTIKYQLPQPSKVVLEIYNISGQRVETLVNEYKDAGYYSFEWNATHISSGVYFYRLQASNFTDVKKCVFVK